MGGNTAQALMGMDNNIVISIINFLSHGGLFFCLFILMFLLVIRALLYSIKRDRLFNNIIRTPSEQTAKAYLDYVRRHSPRLLSTRRNHPTAWANVRNKWYTINRSNRIPTQLKADILGTLQRDGLYVNNTIIDNYIGPNNR